MLAFLRLRIGGTFLNFLLKRSVLILQGISAELNREKVNLTNRLILCKQRLVRGDTSASAEIIALEARLFALFSFEIEGVKGPLDRGRQKAFSIFFPSRTRTN